MAGVNGAVAVTWEAWRPISKSFPGFLSTGIARLVVGSAVSRSVQVEADLEPGRVARKLEVTGEVGQLLYRRGEDGVAQQCDPCEQARQ